MISMPDIYLLATIFLPLAGAAVIWTVGGGKAGVLPPECRWSRRSSRSCWPAILIADYHARRRAFAVSSICLAGHASPDRRAVQRRARRAQPVAVRPDGAADGHRRAGQLGVDHRSARHCTTACCCCLETGMLGVFAARDIILFYIFFEFTLIPLFFLIGIWGSEDRRYAAIKFFMFTLAGSLLTFLGLLAIVLWDAFVHARHA